MRLEMQIKKKVISAVLAYYKDDVIKIFERFFYNKDRLARYNNKTGNAFLAILKNPQILTDSQKFIRLVNVMYLSDVLFLVLCCEQFRKDEIVKTFYYKKPEKYGLLTKSFRTLLELRNAVAHYNFKNFEQNRNEYIESLTLFETIIERNIRGFAEFPKFPSKPSVKTILLAINEKRPDLVNIDPYKDDEMEYYYNKHRVLLDLCDDIALFNGYEPKDLPSPWTILRQMYALKQGNKPQDKINITTLPLFKDYFTDGKNV